MNLLSFLLLLLSYAEHSVYANPATLLRRELLGDPKHAEQPGPFDPQSDTPVPVDRTRSLNTCRNFTFESAVLYASCTSGTDGTDTSPSVNLSQCIGNQSGNLVFESE
jgi:hypothetical protein